MKALRLLNCKTASLVQHPVPIKPLGYVDVGGVEPTVYLTKKEIKRARRLRRGEKMEEEREKQVSGDCEAAAHS